MKKLFRREAGTLRQAEEAAAPSGLQISHQASLGPARPAAGEDGAF